MTLLSFKNKVTFAKCNNVKCSNFTTNHDLSGSWCMDECFIEFETGEKITHRELLQMKVSFLETLFMFLFLWMMKIIY